MKIVNLNNMKIKIFTILYITFGLFFYCKAQTTDGLINDNTGTYVINNYENSLNGHS